MAKWGGSRAGPKLPNQTFLYAQCSCQDFDYRRNDQMTPEKFMIRLGKSKRVMVARHTDLLLLPEMSSEMDEKYCVWRDEMGIFNLILITREAISRTHKVTLSPGAYPTDFVCKHIICAARWVMRSGFGARHVHVHWRDDPFVANLIKGYRYFAGDKWAGIHRILLTHHVMVSGWGLDDPLVTKTTLEVSKSWPNLTKH